MGEAGKTSLRSEIAILGNSDYLADWEASTYFRIKVSSPSQLFCHHMPAFNDLTHWCSA